MRQNDTATEEEKTRQDQILFMPSLPKDDRGGVLMGDLAFAEIHVTRMSFRINHYTGISLYAGVSSTAFCELDSKCRIFPA